MSTEFDREINLRGVIGSGIALAAVALVVSLLMWWLLRGFSSFDEKRDVRLTPIETANPQQPPPEPRLQIAPNDDMKEMQEKENRELTQPAWVDRQQGIVRVPIDLAMEVMISKGLSPVQSASPSKPSPPPEGQR